jgi:hypothetical protein
MTMTVAAHVAGLFEIATGLHAKNKAAWPRRARWVGESQHSHGLAKPQAAICRRTLEAPFGGVA